VPKLAQLDMRVKAKEAGDHTCIRLSRPMIASEDLSHPGPVGLYQGSTSETEELRGRTIAFTNFVARQGETRDDNYSRPLCYIGSESFQPPDKRCSRYSTVRLV
jgi:hypothetical protein